MFSVSSETLLGVRRFCALWVLIDSVPEPMGQNAVTMPAEVLNVVVAGRDGFMDVLCLAVKLAH